MQKLRATISRWLIVLIVPVIATCGSDPVAPPTVASIAVTPANPILAALGLTQQFVATARDQDGQLITGKTFNWSSSASGVATIDAASGLATATGNGTTTISAGVDGITGMATLEVSQVITTTSIAAAGGTTTLGAIGQTVQLTANGEDSGGSTVAGTSAAWSSSDEAVATVSATGLVTAIANGTATITGTVDGISGTLDITVAQSASLLAITQQPSPSAASGAIFARQPIVQLQDANGNPVGQTGVSVMAAIASNGGTLGGTTTVLTDGNGAATFTNLSITGAAAIRTLEFASTSLTSATSAGISIGAGTVDPSTSTVSVPVNTTVGMVTSITVQARDALSNNLASGGDAVSVVITGANPGTPSVIDNGDGTYTAQYTPQGTGADNVAASINGAAVGNSPVTTTVAPGVLDPSSSTATLTTAAAGSPNTITIQARDAFGNALTSGGATTSVSVTGANTATPVATDNGDGTYTASYTPMFAGTDMIAITLDGVAIAGSPLTNTVGQGTANAAQTTAAVPAGVSGAVTTIVVQTRDAAGNILTSGNEVVTVNITGANSIAPGVTDNGDGTYTATYTPIVAGSDNVVIRLNGTQISGSPYTSVVSAGALNPTQSTAVVPATGMSGAVTTITVTSRDANSNIVSTGGAAVLVNVSGANTATASVTDNADGTYTATYTPVALGTDNISITMNGSSISGSPFNSTVGAGAPDPAMTSATVPASTAAGSPTAILVTTRDVNGNPLATGGQTVAIAVSGANTASPTVNDAGDGTYSAIYTPTLAGTDNIAITLNGVTIGGGPYSTTVNPGSVDATQSTASVPAGVASGNVSLIVVTARDANGNALATGGETVVVTVSGANTATPAVTDNNDGTYSASYTPTVAGTDNVSITLNGVAINGDPFTTVVGTGAADAAQSTATVPAGTAGTTTLITIQANDASGNPLTTGGEAIIVDITGANTVTPTVTDNADGTYSTSYQPTIAGTDNVAITLNGNPIGGSPYSSVVAPGALDPAQSTAVVPAGVAGAVTAITVTSRDGFGNPVPTAGATVAIDITGANTATPAVTDNGDGTYSASYTPTLTGTDNVAITINSTAISGSPIASVVAAGPVDASQSTATVPATGTSGIATSIVVQARDANGNALTAGGSTVVVSVTGVNTDTPVVTDNADGTYSASYTPTMAGADNVAITLDGGAISGSPFATTVGAGAAVAAQTTATVPATGTSGVATNIVVQARDVNDNPLTTGGATVTVAVSGANSAAPTVTDNSDGTYSASYTPTAVGTDNIAITLGGVTINSSPFASVVGAGTADPTQTTATVPTTGSSGAATAITVQARDAAGNALAVGGSTVIVTVTGVNSATPAVTDNADGTYSASYTPTAIGVDNIEITLGGSPINGSPFSSTVGSGVADAAQTTAVVPGTGTSGTATNMTVQARDAAGNALTIGGAAVVVTVTGANSATPVVTDNADGTYSTSYTPSAVGTDNIAITLGGAAINSSPFSSVISPGAVSAAQSTAIVPGGTPAVATNITITGKDAAGNPVTTGGATVIVDVTGANTATPAVTDNADGTYSASYTPANAGNDMVAITLDGTPINGSPYTSVIGSTVDPTQSTATVPAGAAGAVTTITIQANDNTGTPLTVGGDIVAANVTGANTATAGIVDNADGTYTATYTPTVAGTDNVAITINAVAISGSPYTSVVAAGTVVDAAMSTIVVPDSGVAGDTTWVNVIARDALGNRVAAGGETVVVFVTGNHLETPAVSDSGNGAYIAAFIPTISGTDQFDATINGVNVGGGPYTSFAKPDTAAAANTTAVVPGSGAIGVATSITIQAKDAFDNNLTAGGATVAVSVSGANTATPVVTDNGDGTYSTSYTPTAAGADNIAITLNTVAINSSPFTSLVGAGAADPAQSTATVPATGTVGVATALSVQAVDGTGTPLTTGGEIVAITVSGANTATPAVTDNADGTYTASYTPTLAGTDNIAITMNSAAISGSPFSSVVSVGGASAANSYAIVPNGTIGTATSIFVQARDAGDNDITTGGATVVVTVTGANPGTPVVTDNGDGTYTASYTPTANGTDDVEITLDAGAILGSSYTSEVSAIPTLSGRISYENNADGNYDVWIINENGTDPINLTNNVFSSDERPHISPDGTKIVFNSDRDGDQDIYVMNSNGSGVVQLTNNPGRDRLPVWSPDGTQILFLSEEGGDSDILVMNADGSSQTNLTNNSVDDFQADWSPDASQIVFYRGGDVWIMNANGSSETNLTNSPSSAEVETSWGSGGITFISDMDGVANGSSEVYTIQPDGMGLTRITDDMIFDYIPSWSSDGRITWITERSGGSGDVWLMDADGNNAAQVTTGGGVKWAPKFQY